MSLLLAACGPGIGGTGTGGDNALYITQAGAKEAQLCQSALSAALSCPTTPSAAAVGTNQVQYASLAGDPELLVVFDGNDVSVYRGCPNLEYSGGWGTLNSDSLFFGSFTGAGQRQNVAANLVVDTAPQAGGGKLVIELRDTSGNILIPKQTLVRLEAPHALPRSCL